MRIGTESYPATWKWHGTCWGDWKCKGRVWWQDQRHGDGDVSTSSTYSRVGSFRGKPSPGKRQLEKKYVQLEKKAEETFPLMSSSSIWKPTSRRPRLQMLSWINASNRPWSCSRPVRGVGQRFKIFRSAHEKLQRRKMSVLKSPKMLAGLRSRCWTNRPKAFFFWLNFLTSIRCRQMFQRFSKSTCRPLIWDTFLSRCTTCCGSSKQNSTESMPRKRQKRQGKSVCAPCCPERGPSWKSTKASFHLDEFAWDVCKPTRCTKKQKPGVTVGNGWLIWIILSNWPNRAFWQAKLLEAVRENRPDEKVKEGCTV